MNLIHVFGAALIAALVSGAALADMAPRIEWRDCPWSQAQPAEARCGDLVVPQSRRVTAGPSIRVFFAIYRATAATPALPDPVVVVPGGPGALFNPPVPYVMRGLAELRQRREVIIIDQRGVGRSAPRLACDAETRAPDGTVEPRRRGADCLAALKQRGVDPAAFNTEETAWDVRDLRVALKLPRWNAMGASYGSRVVLRLAQIDPDGTRSAVVMAALPLAPSLARAENGERRRELLDRLFADCNAEPACAVAYGNLALKLARIRHIFRQMARAPLPDDASDALRHLRDVERQTGGIERALIAQLDWAEELPKLPRAIADLDDFLTGAKPIDRARIDAIYGVGASRPMPPIDDTLILATTRCPEDVLPEERAANERAGRERGRRDRGPRDACAMFEPTPVPDAPGTILPPLLVLTGAYDIRTLSTWSGLIGARYPGAIVARLGDAGHDVSYRHPCANALMNAFVADPKAKLDLACVERHARPKFEVPDPVR